MFRGGKTTREDEVVSAGMGLRRDEALHFLYVFYYTLTYIERVVMDLVGVVVQLLSGIDG